MTKVLTRTVTTVPPLKDDNNQLKYFSTEDKANRLAENFAKTFTPHNEPSIPEFIQETDTLVEQYLASECNDITPIIEPYEIKNYLKYTKNNKAPGPNEITNFVLKKLPVEYLKIIANIFNACFKLKYFPKKWKTAIILVFQKPAKDPTQPTSYRPISLLNTLSKTLEAMFLLHLNAFLKNNNIIRKEQFGFRENHSTQHQILRITEHVTKRFNWNQNTGAALLDVEKAFDSVWINGLLRKLIELNAPKWMIFFLNSYLKNRTFTVKLDNTYSRELDIKAGVPQGSLIGPTIFNININDIPTTPVVNIGIYADDTVPFTSSTNNGKIVRELNKALSLIKD